jgi:hypothetical protein
VGTDSVKVTSNAATDLVEAAAMWWQGMQVQKQLTEVLKQ